MRKLTGLFLSLLLLAACAPQAGSPGAPLAWIDDPLDGTSLPLEEVIVVSHAADPGGIAQFELSVNGTVISSAGAAEGGSLVSMHQAWDPAGPGEYILEVRAKNNAGGWSDYAQVVVTIAGDPLTLVLEPSPTPTYGATATIPAVKFIPSMHANCRAGPGEMYDILTTLLPGAEYPIEGVNQGSTWWYLLMPGNTHCWAAMATGVSSSPPREMPVVLDPPVPARTPTQQTASGCYDTDPVTQQVYCRVPCSPNYVPGGACTP